MAAAAISMSAGREMRVNFTLAIASQPHTFLVSRPRQMSRTLLFLSPFTTTVYMKSNQKLSISHEFPYFCQAWLAIFGSTLLVGPMLYFVHKVSPVTEIGRDMIPKSKEEKTGGLNRVLNCIWYMYGALMQQGNFVLERVCGARACEEFS
jgi:glutamate receptor, ionotropic, invertebrate